MCLENGGVVTQSVVDAATRKMSYQCLRVLWEWGNRINPSRLIEVLLTEKWRWRTRFAIYLVDYLYKRLQRDCQFEFVRAERKIRSMVYSWCKQKHVPVQRWNSLHSLHHVVYRGDLDHDGNMLGRAPDCGVVSDGRIESNLSRCDYVLRSGTPDCVTSHPFLKHTCTPISKSGFLDRNIRRRFSVT